ncbi:minor tail protein [Gordonia phage Sienna]|uniref:Minor tail protein n=1 Tax=Gordonia phage Sienna TaxID=2759396 RepID=A0A7L7STY3_9CAUD|nr:minor tail protein [Gordonia phage Sienna]
MKIIVEEAVTGNILTRDLALVQPPEVVRTLSGPSSIKFSVFPDEPSMEGILFKGYGQMVHVEIDRQDGTPWVFGSGITQPPDIDAETGAVTITANGFSGYPDQIPWLQNYNPIAVDPFEVIHRIWTHIQAQPQGNLGVTVSPASSNTLLLPGFYYDGSEFVLDFFAYFVRSEDYRDCLEEIHSLCRDVPIDFFEDSVWNAGRTAINKTLRLAYPRGGTVQNGLIFKQRENILSMSPAQEMDIQYNSEVIVRGWFPGKMHKTHLVNADPTRYRRVIKDEDALINSRERSAARAGRKLAIRQVPHHWGSITVDMYHPNAPWGTYDVGDDILISGEMPMEGRKSEWHRIMTIQPNDQAGVVQMTTKHVDAFNYDPITFPE